MKNMQLESLQLEKEPRRLTGYGRLRILERLSDLWASVKQDCLRKTKLSNLVKRLRAIKRLRV